MTDTPNTPENKIKTALFNILRTDVMPRIRPSDIVLEEIPYKLDAEDENHLRQTAEFTERSATAGVQTVISITRMMPDVPNAVPTNVITKALYEALQETTGVQCFYTTAQVGIHTSMRGLAELIDETALAESLSRHLPEQHGPRR